MRTKRAQVHPVGRLKPIGRIPSGLVGEVEVEPGFLLANGFAVSRTKFARLFAKIGTAFGVGDGSTTFNLPDFKGKAPHGQATAGTYAVRGATGGAETVTLVTAEMASHSHTHQGNGSDTADVGTANQGCATTSTAPSTGSTGGGGSHPNLPPCQVENFALAY